MIIRRGGFIEFAASHRGACGFALQHFSGAALCPSHS
jgi:hypothetical protein